MSNLIDNMTKLLLVKMLKYEKFYKNQTLLIVSKNISL